MVAEDYLEYMYSKGYYDNSRELQNKNIFGEKPFIQFKNRDDFNVVSDWNFTLGDVIDINYSEMIIFFKDNKALTEWEGCILWNHIREENLIIERTK